LKVDGEAGSNEGMQVKQAAKEKIYANKEQARDEAQL